MLPRHVGGKELFAYVTVTGKPGLYPHTRSAKIPVSCEETGDPDLADVLDRAGDVTTCPPVNRPVNRPPQTRRTAIGDPALRQPGLRNGLLFLEKSARLNWRRGCRGLASAAPSGLPERSAVRHRNTSTGTDAGIGSGSLDWRRQVRGFAVPPAPDCRCWGITWTRRGEVYQSIRSGDGDRRRVLLLLPRRNGGYGRDCQDCRRHCHLQELHVRSAPFWFAGDGEAAERSSAAWRLPHNSRFS